MTNTTDLDESPNIAGKVWRTIQLIVAVPLFVTALGVFTGGLVVAVQEGSITGRMVAILLLMLAVAAAAAFWVWKLGILTRSTEPVSASTKRAKLFMGLSMAIGVIIGLGFAIGGDSPGGTSDLFSNGPLDPQLATGLIAIYLIGVPVVGWFWHRSIDEHEALANQQGALAGVYAYSMIAPTWWVGERAGLFPPQEPMIVFAIVMTIWLLVWSYKRST